MEGQINAALRFLNESTSGGVLSLTDDVMKQLKEKHPDSQSAKLGSTTNNIVTRNSFEPLGDDTQVDVRNEINCNTNREDKNSRRPSCSQKKRKSNRSGSMEPPSEPETMQSIRRKEIIIAGDSILKNLQGHKMSKTSGVKVSSFPGCTTLDMKDHIKPLLRRT